LPGVESEGRPVLGDPGGSRRPSRWSGATPRAAPRRRATAPRRAPPGPVLLLPTERQTSKQVEAFSLWPRTKNMEKRRRNAVVVCGVGWGADWLTLRHGHGLRVCGSWLGLLVSGRRAERVRLREGEKRAAPPPVCRECLLGSPSLH
jgi:hypothetical protein